MQLINNQPETRSTSSDLAKGVREVFGAKPAAKSPEEMIVAVFDRYLDNRYCLIRHAVMQGKTVTLPFVLVGPSGVTLVLPMPVGGMFRVSDAGFEKWDDERRKYRPLSPNPVIHARQLLDQLNAYLVGLNLKQIPTGAVIAFTHPGSYIEGSHSDIRLLTLEGLERFSVNLMKADPIVTLDSIRLITSHFQPPGQAYAPLVPEVKDRFSYQDESEPQKRTLPEINIPLPQDEKVVKTINRLPMTNKQLIFIGILALVNILIAISLIVVLLYFA